MAPLSAHLPRHAAIIGVGSNMQAAQNIGKAKQMIADLFDVTGESLFVQTKPIGFALQDDFTNGAILVQTDLSREIFEKTLGTIEDRLGRVRTENRFGPRTIDLDLVLWDGAVIDTDIYTRDFLLTAVCQVVPGFVLPPR